MPLMVMAATLVLRVALLGYRIHSVMLKYLGITEAVTASCC